ncbi:MAG: hypothetical protein KGS48_16715, partial [Bacteroidetes bacterium]|nr:hypothetical protein [Bacteroidota bacterium]
IINDKVYIDGREVENGSSIELQNEIPDMESFDLEVPMPPMPPPSPSDFQMEFNIPDPVYAPRALSPSELEKLNKTLAKAQKEIAKQQKSLSKSQKRMLNDQMQELERIQKENIQIQRDAMRAQRDLLRAQEEARRSVEYARTEAFRAKMQAERDRERAALNREDALREGRIHEQLRRALLTDALITNPDKYNMHLSEKEMRVNGKIQDEAIKKKYLEYYKSISGRTLKNADSIQIEKNHTN